MGEPLAKRSGNGSLGAGPRNPKMTRLPPTRPAPSGRLVLICGVVTGLLAPVTANAQRRFESVMILAPTPDNRTADSGYAQQLGEEMRDFLTRWRRNLHTIAMCSVSDACERFVEGDAIANYAKLVGADFHVSGRFRRVDGRRVIDFDLGETGIQGGFPHYTTSFTFVGDSTWDEEQFARQAVRRLWNTLSDAIDAAEHARQCWVDIRDRKYDNARGHARDAMEAFPHHPSAAACAGRVFSETAASPDSVVWALESATTGDSTIYQVWADLANAYLRRGDTAAAVRARAQEARGDKDDTTRLIRLASQMNEMGFTDSAATILGEYVGRNPTDEEIGELLVRLCLTYEQWDCALQAMAARYVADSTLVGDTAFYFRAITIARSASDTSLLRWTTEAVTRIDSVVTTAWERAEKARQDAEGLQAAHREMLVSHAGALASGGFPDSALRAYAAILEIDSTDVRAALGLARLTLDASRLRIDSTSPLDTTTLARVDTVLQTVARHTDDPIFLETAASLYLDVASRMVQARVEPSLAAELARRARAFSGEDDDLRTRTYAIGGLAAFYDMLQVDAQLRVLQTCDLLTRERALIEHGSADLAYGAPQLPGVAERILATFDAYRQLIPQHTQALGCDGSVVADNGGDGN